MIYNMTRVLDKYWNLFLIGTGYTLLMSAITVFFGLIFGALLALLKRNNLGIRIGKKKFCPLRILASAYIEVIRGTPILLQLYVFYFLVPKAFPMLEISEFTSVMIALICNSSAYVSEIIRAGIEAVDHGQTEAARSLGLNSRQTMIKIVLPQAVKNILPAMGNEFIMMIKETSLASTFFVGELMTQCKTITGALYLTIEPLVIVAAIYFILTFSLSKVVAVFERRMSAGD